MSNSIGELGNTSAATTGGSADDGVHSPDRRNLRMPRPPGLEEQAHLTREWISQCELVENMWTSIRREFPDLHDAQIERYLALLVLENTLGYQWVCEHIDRGGQRRNATDIYLRSRPSGIRERRENYVRVRELARRIFELAPEPFAERLNNNLRNRDLEGAAFEADVARMLIALPVNLDMPEESGARGGDYDIAVWLQPDRWIAVEIKTRSEHAPYSRKALNRILGKARSQLPAQGPGAIFFKVSTPWLDDNEYQRSHHDVVTSFLGSTHRVDVVNVG